jgi:H+/gluconate symporter-like permease
MATSSSSCVISSIRGRVTNFAFTELIPVWYGKSYTVLPDVLPGIHTPIAVPISNVVAIWAVEGALLCRIVLITATAFGRVRARFAVGTRVVVSGALLASINTASEYGFGSVIAVLPGFYAVSHALKGISDPLINAAVSVTTLAGITGSA